MLKRTLDNGLRVLCLRNAAAPAVAIQVWVQVGSADEHEGQFGLAHVHEHMLFKGTETRAVGRIASEVEGAGGEINAFTSFDQTVYHVVMSSRFFHVGLDVLADAVQRSAFDADELSRELEVVLEEIKRSDDSAPRVAAKMLFDTAFEVHPYSRPVIGSVASVKSFDRDRVTDFYRRWYTGQNMVVVAVGDLDEEDAADQIAAAFAQLPAGGRAPERAAEPAPSDLRFRRETSRFSLTHLSLAFPVPEGGHPDVPLLDVLALIVGQGESSRLVQSVKRTQGLVNDVSCYAYTPRDPGLFVVSARIPKGDANPALKALLTEVERVCREPVQVEELTKAVNLIDAQRVYERESVQGQARKAGYYESVCGSADYDIEYLRRVGEATPDALLEVARRYFEPSRLTCVALVPEEDTDALTEASVRQAISELSGRSRVEPVGWTPPGRVAPAHIAAERGQLHVHTLDCGARVVMVADTGLGLTALRAIMPGGVLAEPSGKNGVAHLTAASMNRGAGERDAAQMWATIESMAAHISASSGRSSVSVRCDALTAGLDDAFELFTDVLLRPRFDDAAVTLERSLQLEHIRSQADRPAGNTISKMLAALFQDHAYGHRVVGTEETVPGLNAADLRLMHAAVVRPDQMVFSAVGDFDEDALLSKINASLAEYAPTGAPAPASLPFTAISARQEIRFSGRGEQAHIAIGYPGISYSDPDRAVLDLLATTLGGQGGRLFLELRDKQSLAYSVSAASVEGLRHGYVYTYMGTSPEKLAVAAAGLERVIDGVRQERITEDELERAKRYIVGTYDVGLQRRSARAGALAYHVLFESPWLEFGEYTDRILAVTTDEVLAVAQRLLNPERAVTCIFEPEG